MNGGLVETSPAAVPLCRCAPRVPCPVPDLRYGLICRRRGTRPHNPRLYPPNDRFKTIFTCFPLFHSGLLFSHFCCWLACAFATFRFSTRSSISISPREFPRRVWLLIKIAAKLWTFLFSTACKFLSGLGHGPSRRISHRERNREKGRTRSAPVQRDVSWFVAYSRLPPKSRPLDGQATKIGATANELWKNWRKNAFIVPQLSRSIVRHARLNPPHRYIDSQTLRSVAAECATLANHRGLFVSGLDGFRNLCGALSEISRPGPPTRRPIFSQCRLSTPELIGPADQLNYKACQRQCDNGHRIPASQLKELTPPPSGEEWGRGIALSLLLSLKVIWENNVNKLDGQKAVSVGFSGISGKGQWNRRWK